jgi:hypothetical protein
VQRVRAGLLKYFDIPEAKINVDHHRTINNFLQVPRTRAVLSLALSLKLIARARCAMVSLACRCRCLCRQQLSEIGDKTGDQFLSDLKINAAPSTAPEKRKAMVTDLWTAAHLTYNTKHVKPPAAPAPYYPHGGAGGGVYRGGSDNYGGGALYSHPQPPAQITCQSCGKAHRYDAEICTGCGDAILPMEFRQPPGTSALLTD